MAVYRKRWLLLQIKPSSFLLSDNGDDIFQTLTAKMIPFLGHVELLDLQNAIDLEILFVHAECPSSGRPFYVVLDEAQNAAENYFTAFVSSVDEAVQRPVLRELLISWLASTAVFIVTGTGISRDVIEETMRSAVVKYDKYTSVSETGNFDTVMDPMVQAVAISQESDSNDTNELDQLAYVSQFIPPAIRSDESIQRLLRRVALWLRGRFRFTTGFVSELLAAELLTPHNLLNQYIKNITTPPERSHRSVVRTELSSLPGFFPTDSSIFVESGENYELSDRTTFNFQKLLASHDNELATIAIITTRFWVRNDWEIPNIAPFEADFVEWGFARFYQEPGQKLSSSRLDEPLALLALGQWLNAEFHESIHHRLAMEVGQNTATGKNTLEGYLAFCLTKLLDGCNQLNHIFYFSKDAPTWTSQRARLVSLHRADAASDIEESLVTFTSRPSHSIGTYASSPEAMVEWLQHDRDAPICFPPTTMGPDLFFIVKLEDNSRIWVALQSKYHSKSLLEPAVLRGAVRSVTPSSYFSSLTDKSSVTDLLLDLPDKRLDAGKYSLLRVIASFPGETRLERGHTTLKDMPFYDDAHPIASLNMTLLAEVTKDMKPQNFIRDLKHHPDYFGVEFRMDGSTNLRDNDTDLDLSPIAPSNPATTSKKRMPDSGLTDMLATHLKKRKKKDKKDSPELWRGPQATVSNRLTPVASSSGIRKKGRGRKKPSQRKQRATSSYMGSTRTVTANRAAKGLQSAEYAGAAWAKQSAELVELHAAADGQTRYSVISKGDFADPLVTCAKDLGETQIVAWMEHKQRSPFCIPTTSNPDLMFVLKLADGSFIWVVVAVTPETSDGKNLLTSLAEPSLFPGEEHDTDTSLQQRAIQLVNTLPSSGRVPKTGPTVLRVVASFENQIQLKRRTTKAAPHASLSMSMFQRLTAAVSSLEIMTQIADSVLGEWDENTETQKGKGRGTKRQNSFPLDPDGEDEAGTRKRKKQTPALVPSTRVLRPRPQKNPTEDKKKKRKEA
ncbi:hypothetical protein B0H15DRAFT_797342 [Mycena belliarum]|uniref:Uncharacterized protein n=1 Tax=Mycena belliarum TaxID=1033014 RepID=A0AAD6UD80_9AGAR|nr:hypothetical protein B0H15DRAFT_797342 [Mycena belliae]